MEHITREYDFSIIVAVYNVQDYLQEAIESVLSQDYPLERIQIILVDDGSTDNSPAICDRYAGLHPENITVIHKQNGGVASARNEGLKHATGQLINFMDSDDKLSKDVFGKVFSFYRDHEIETDVFTIPIELFGTVNEPHWQNWKFDKGSRIINLHEEYQTTDMSCSASFFHIRVKNSILFDSRLVVSEDTKVLLNVLAEKMTLGVVTDCSYFYRKRDHGAESLVQSASKKKGWYFDYFTHLVDWATDYYKERFGYVPGFVQYELLCDLQWRICADYSLDILSEEEKEAYYNRYVQTISRFDDCYIAEQRLLNAQQKAFLLKKKHDNAIRSVAGENDIRLFAGKTELSSIKSQPAIIEFIKVENNAIAVEGAVPLYGMEPQEIRVFLDVQGKQIACEVSRRTVDDQFCLGELTQWATAFCGRLQCEELTLPAAIGVSIQIDHVLIHKDKIEFGEFAPLSQLPASYYSIKKLLLRPNEDGFTVSRGKPFERSRSEVAFLKNLWRSNGEGARKAVIVRAVYNLLKHFKHKPIWLFSDRLTRAGDNGEALFRFVKEHHNTEIKAYFLLNSESADRERMQAVGKVISAGCMKHKLLYLLCDYNISSQADYSVAMPFRGHNEGYRDILAEKKFVFLQHGVTKDDLSSWLAKSKMNIFGFITVAKPEYDSIISGQYGYTEQEVWLTGFPRFDRLPKEGETERQITIAPTWRNSLMQSARAETGERELNPHFIGSAYFQFYNRLLNDERLLDAANQYQYQIAFLPHPNLQKHINVFKRNEKVLFLGEEASYESVYRKSSLMVTDYSSVVFDFVYLKKPVVYIQFDKDEFFSGNHTYKKGYFDYERDGFGEVEYDLDGVVNRIIGYMANGCTMKEQYQKRVETFFAYQDRNNSRRVYDQLCQLQQRMKG